MYILISFGLLFISIILLLIWGEYNYRFSRIGRSINKLPGPKVLPFLGCLLEFLDDSAGIFIKLRRWAKEYPPIYRVWNTFFFPSVLISSPEDMQTILSNTKHNDKSDIYLFFHDWLGEGLLTSNGDKWQQRRKIITPTFHFNILRRFVPIFNKHSVGLVNGFKEDNQNEVNILHHIHKASLHTIAEAAMGATLNDKESEKRYRNAIHRVGELTVYRLLRPWFYFRIVALCTYHFYEERILLHYLKGFTKKVIDEREKTFNKDEVMALQEDTSEEQDIYLGKKKKRLAMLDLLLSAKIHKEIDYNGIREEVDTFMFEGHDTVSMALSFMFLLLASHPDVQEKLYEEITSVLQDNEEPTYEDLHKLTYMEMVIKESLRIYPSVPLISRLSGEDFTTVNGHVIPKGTVLILNIYDTHHLESIYPDPEKFMPERFSVENSKNRHPYAHLAFSAGSRNCIGQRYAMLNMKCKVAAVIRKFRLYPVDTPETITLIADIILRTKDPIRLKLKSRTS